MIATQKFGLQYRLKESYLADKAETNTLLEMSNIFYQFILFFGQAINFCSYIRHFNVLTFFLGKRKKAESLLKDNALPFTEADNMLFGSKYGESLRSKN